MSLLDEAKAKANPKPDCKMAKQLLELFSEAELYEPQVGEDGEEKPSEVVEILQAMDVPYQARWKILKARGLGITVQTFGDKMRHGCTCPWCLENWVLDDVD